MEDKKKRTFYQILGVSPGASVEEIKNSFMRLAKKHHPDKKAGDKDAEEYFTSVTEAYKVLSDAVSRYAYDLELGIQPEENIIPPERRLEEPSVTGNLAIDYVEELTGGIKLPDIKEVDENVYEFRGLEDPTIKKAYEAGLYSIGTLENLSAHQYYELGMELLRKGNYDGAIAYFVETVRMNPQNMQYRFMLGCSYEAIGVISEAASEYEVAADIASRRGYSSVPVREALINVYMKLEKYGEVKKQCMIILSRGLKSSVADNALGIVRMMEKKIKKRGGPDEHFNHRRRWSCGEPCG